MASRPARLFLRRIAALEQDLAGRLRDWREGGGFDPVLHESLGLWSKAVWTAAGELGPADLAPATVERGLVLARRPVFVCGVHRSGTTLLRDLLDGHPALVIVPSESNYYTELERPLRRSPPAVREEALGRRWLERAVNPSNQAPFWLLGRSSAGASPYVELAREFRAWLSLLQGPSRPLVAFALAWAMRRGGGAIPPRAAMWVEKSPTGERFLDRLWREFPHAKVIHVVRRPDAVLASYKAALAKGGRPARLAAGAVGALARSYRIALDRSRSAPSERYHLVRYEDLGPERIARIAEFLGIAASPTLLEPTVGGAPATSNSSFATGRTDPAAGLNTLERDLLALALGRRSAQLGYEIEPVSPAGRLLARLGRAQARPAAG